MKKLIFSIALASLLVLGGSAIADICTIDATPAATLLLPYFEVDIDNANGVDTFFSINNASASSVLTHVTIYTDMSVEALDFNVYLTGYDVQTIGVGQIVRDGILPVTGDANAYSPRGPFSDPHPGSQNAIDGYPTCNSLFPYVNPQLETEVPGIDGYTYLDHLQAILTGGPSELYDGRCGGFDHGDNIARGYILTDVVNDCTLLNPCDAGYFRPGPAGQVGEYDNVIWGDWYMINYGQFQAEGDTLVHIEAVDPLDQVGLAEIANGSFYQRCEFETFGPAFIPGYVYSDYREPLATTYATRFYQNAAFDGGTNLLVWRDSIISPAQFPSLGDFGDQGFDCNIGPLWYPLTEHQVVSFDEEENTEITICPISPCPTGNISSLFKLEAQRFDVADLELSFESGWLYLNLNQETNPLYYVNVLCGSYGQYCAPYAAQAWVQSVHSAEGRYSVGLPAIQLDSFCDGTSVTLGPGDDGFPVVDTSSNVFYSYYSYYTGTDRGAGIDRTHMHGVDDGLNLKN
ncbi:MAG: hypothetical protein U0X73_14065 [Thermoanaerobaculia bacterium]